MRRESPHPAPLLEGAGVKSELWDDGARLQQTFSGDKTLDRDDGTC
jgi:hypothetical protein